MKHNWTPKNADEMTLLTFHDLASDKDTEVWVHENENPDLDETGEIECFRLDGTQILVDRARDVHVYRKTCRKWVDRNVEHPTRAQLRTGAQRQETTYALVQIGVDATFKPTYDREHVTEIAGYQTRIRSIRDAIQGLRANG